METNINEEMIYIGRCSDLLSKGLSDRQIAKVMNKPLERVQTWISMIARANVERLKQEFRKG